MKRVMCYGDSLTWGIIPPTRNRYSADDRWPKVLQSGLEDVEVIEEALTGRTTAFEFPSRPYRNGLTMLPMFLEQHAPLDLIIIMLGTNDFFALNEPSAEIVMSGLDQLSRVVSRPQVEPSMPIPDLILMAPPPPRPVPQSPYPFAMVTDKMEHEAKRLPHLLALYAQENNFGYFDASHFPTDDADGIHLSGATNRALGSSMVSVVKQRLTIKV